MIKKIRNQWNKIVGAPENDNPVLIHRDKSMLMYHLILEEVNELKDAIRDSHLTDEERIIAIADALADATYLILGTVNQFGLQDEWDKIIEEVHRSNMTKTVDGKLIKREDGKVLKPKTYSKPDLSFILKKFNK